MTTVLRRASAATIALTIASLLACVPAASAAPSAALSGSPVTVAQQQLKTAPSHVTTKQPKAKPFKKYKNCTALRKDYPHGVAKSKSTIDMKNGKRGGKITSSTFVSAKLYKLNVKSDRDKDGWACER